MAGPNGNTIDFDAYDDDGMNGAGGPQRDEGVTNGLYDDDDTGGDPYAGLRPEDDTDGSGADDGFDFFQGDSDDGGFGPDSGQRQPGQQGQQQQQRQPNAPQRRGPAPALMGRGNMSRRDVDLIGQDFWNTPRGQQQQQDPQQRFFEQLLERMPPQGQQQQQDPEAAERQMAQQWDNFFGNRVFGQRAEEMLEAFTKANDDPQESTRILHQSMQRLGRDVYRQVASDMQPTIMRIAETVAQQLIEKRMQSVNNEQQFTSALTTLLNRNPAWRQFGQYPSNALKQALAHTNGDMQRAVMLTEKHITRTIAQVNQRRNSGGNRQSAQNTNWHNEARR